jgi:hypothetical protein
LGSVPGLRTGAQAEAAIFPRVRIRRFGSAGESPAAEPEGVAPRRSVIISHRPGERHLQTLLLTPEPACDVSRTCLRRLKALESKVETRSGVAWPSLAPSSAAREQTRIDRSKRSAQANPALIAGGAARGQTALIACSPVRGQPALIVRGARANRSAGHNPSGPPAHHRPRFPEQGPNRDSELNRPPHFTEQAIAETTHAENERAAVKRREEKRRPSRAISRAFPPVPVVLTGS